MAKLKIRKIGDECLRKVCYKVVCVFKADGKANEICGNTCRYKLFVVHLAVCCACGVQAARARICNVCFDRCELELLHKCFCRFSAALNAEAYNAARAFGKVLLCERVVFVAFESAVFNPSNVLVR